MLRFASLNPVGKLRMEGHKLCPQFHGHRTTDLRFRPFEAILYPAKNKTNFTKSSGAREHRIEFEGLAHHTRVDRASTMEHSRECSEHIWSRFCPPPR